MRQNKAAQLNTVAKRILAGSLAVVVSSCLALCPSVDTYAATGKLDVKTAKNLALKNSGTYQSNKSKVELAKVQYAQAVKKLKLKKKNQSTLRWSPLLKFSLPQKADLEDEFGYTYKPIEMQIAITTAQHKVDSTKYGIDEEIGQLLCKIYLLQERIKFNESRKQELEKTIARTRIRVSQGEATEKDLKNMETSLTSVESSIKTDNTEMGQLKDKLSNKIGLDVRVNYSFSSPFVDADIQESMVKGLQERALELDHSYYETKIATNSSLVAMNTNYNLMKNQYGGKMSILDTYVNQAKSGRTIDSAAFKVAYEKFLYEIDKKWQGKKRILFIKFPRDFLKGAIDGVNYVEDEPYALYEGVLDYQSCVVEENAAKQELMQLVKDTHANYVKARQVVKDDEANLKKEKEELEKLRKQNLLGKLSYEEYKTELDQYESDQLDYLSDKASLSEILYTYDKVTCGGITELLSGTSINLKAGAQGESYVVEDEGDGVYYYITSDIPGEFFKVGVTVTDDFEGSVTDFELYVDNVQVGEKTPVGETITHWSFDLDNITEAKIRLYDGEDIVTDSPFDPNVTTGKLDIPQYSIQKDDDTYVADFFIDEDEDEEFITINISPKAGQMIAYYNIKDEDGEYVIDDTKIPVKTGFKDLSLLAASLDDLTISFFDESEELLYECYFSTSNLTIHKKEDTND